MRARVWWVGGLLLFVVVMSVAIWEARVKAAEEYATQITPAYVVTPGKGVDPRTITVVFPWQEVGFCAGQFRVTTTETPTKVIVSQVESRPVDENEGCAGIGTDGAVASHDVELESPLGTRSVTRALDGKLLDVSKP